MKLWLTRQANGRYMLTHRVPVIKQVGRANKYDAYIEPGDPIGVRHLCEPIIERLLPELKLQPLDFIRVTLSMNQVVKESK